MKTTIFVLLLTVYAGLINTQNSNIENDLAGFNSFLEEEKAEALNAATTSLDRFLEKNYPNNPSTQESIKAFLYDILIIDSIRPNWSFTGCQAQLIIDKMESSGMRSEIWLNEFEDYDPKYLLKKDGVWIDTSITLDVVEDVEIIPITQREGEPQEMNSEEGQSSEGSIEFNQIGMFIYGLEKFAPKDSFVQEYVAVKRAAGNISPKLVANGFLTKNRNYDEPFFQRMIVAEFYYFMLKSSLEETKEQK